MQNLTEQELEFLQTLVELHEQHGQVTVHANMRADEREMVGSLVLKGYVELRELVKDHAIEQRPVVPTPVARMMFQEAA